MEKTILALLRLVRSAMLLFETSSRDGFATVFRQKLGQRNMKQKLLCLFFGHSPVNLSITTYSSKTSLSTTKKSKFKRLPNQLAFIFVRFYQATFSQFLGGRCRYYPSCSHYATEAYEKFTFFRATQLVFLRFISCHPLSKKPFYDPVPMVERNSYE